MEAKLKAAFLCFFGLIALAQGFTIKLQNSGKYQKCLTHAVCETDGAGFQKIYKCINMLKPEEQAEEFQEIDGFFDFKATDFPGLPSEYCQLDDNKQKEAYTGIINGLSSYEKDVCADSSKKEKCNRMLQNLVCFFEYLDQVKKSGDC